MKQDLDKKIREATYGKDEPNICKSCVHRMGCDIKDRVCFNKCDYWKQGKGVMEIVQELIKEKKM